MAIKIHKNIRIISKIIEKYWKILATNHINEYKILRRAKNCLIETQS